jgi:hypothetical protein
VDELYAQFPDLYKVMCWVASIFFFGSKKEFTPFHDANCEESRRIMCVRDAYCHSSIIQHKLALPEELVICLNFIANECRGELYHESMRSSCGLLAAFLLWYAPKTENEFLKIILILPL